MDNPKGQAGVLRSRTGRVLAFLAAALVCCAVRALPYLKPRVVFETDSLMFSSRLISSFNIVPLPTPEQPEYNTSLPIFSLIFVLTFFSSVLNGLAGHR